MTAKKNYTTVALVSGGCELTVKGYSMKSTSLSTFLSKKESSQAQCEGCSVVLGSLLDAVAESAFLVDCEGIIVFANHTAAKRLACTSDSLVGRPILDLLPQEISKRRLRYAEDVLKTRKAVHFKDERDGIHFVNYIHPVFNYEGDITHLAIFSRDITEQQQGQAELGMLSMLNEALLANIPDLILTLDRNGIVLKINHPLGQKDISTIIGKPLYPFLQKENQELARTLVDGVFKTGEPCEFVKRATLWKGVRWVDARLIPIIHEGHIAAVTCIVRDVTAMKEYEKRLEHKNAAMSELIEHMKEEKTTIHQKIYQSIENRILPLMEKIKINAHTPEYVDIAEQLIKELVPETERKKTWDHYKLTPREQQICAMIKHGLSTKEIAALSHCSSQTVEKQRKSIRKKLGLYEKSENLYSYLNHLDRNET